MDPKLRKLIEAWQAERCPPRLLQRVRAETSSEAPQRMFFNPAWLLPIAAVPLLALGMVLLLRPAAQPPETLQLAESTEATEAAVNEQTAQLALLSLTYMGSLLLDNSRTVESRIKPSQESIFHEPYQQIRSQLITHQYQ